MSTIYLHSVYLFRRDTKEKWEAENPVLLPGEVGVVMNPGDREIMKIGDGKTAWRDLEWVYLLRPDDRNAVLDAAARAQQQAEAAEESAGEARQAAASAAESAAESAGQAGEAEAARQQAEAARDDAEKAKQNAETARDDATSAAAAANTAASEASASAADASISATRAEVAAETALEAAANGVKIYGVRFDGSANSGATVHRLYNAEGLVAGVGTDRETAVNDFDNIYPWSARRRCCGMFDEDGNFVINAYKGELGYAENGDNGYVWVEHSLFYYKHTYEEDGAEEILITATPLAGFLPAPIFLNSDGTVRQKAYTAAYPMATVNGKATSVSGVFPDVYSLDTSVAAARANGDRYTVTQTAEWYTECLYMWVEFATRDLQSVMAGASSLTYSAAHTATVETVNDNYIIVAKATAEQYVTGQTIGIGNSLGSKNIASNRVVQGFGGYDDNTQMIYFDGDPVNVPVGSVVYTLPWKNGSCDNVLSSSGSPVSNTSGKYNCIYRGKEKPYGDSFEWISDVLFFDGMAYYLPDATKYTGKLTEDYLLLNFPIPTEDGYVTKLWLDDRFPWVRIPCEIGGASTTWYADYYGYPRSGLRAARVGGDWSSGSTDGPVYWYCNTTPSTTTVSCRARLSYRGK